MGCTVVSKEACNFSVFCLLCRSAADTLQLPAMHVLLAVEALLLTPRVLFNGAYQIQQLVSSGR